MKWIDTPLAQRVGDAVNNINGDLPIATSYRRMIHSANLRRFWQKEAREEYTQAQFEFLATLVRVMYHNRETDRENIRNLLFFTSFLCELKHFQMVTIATPSTSLISKGSEILGGESGIIRVPRTLVKLIIYNPMTLAKYDSLLVRRRDPMYFAIEKARCLSGLVGLLQEGGFDVSPHVREILALTAMLRSITIITPYEGEGFDQPPALSPQQVLHIQTIIKCLDG